MRLRKTSIGVGASITALAAFAASNASAGFVYDGSVFGRGGFSSFQQLYRVPQPTQSPPGATSRPSNRDMRAAPSMGGRGMRGGGMGGGRMNGGLGRR